MTDAHLWLEEFNDETLAWASKRSDATIESHAGPEFDSREKAVYDILSAKDKLDLGTLRGQYIYNFHTDLEHPRGLWRRTLLEDYLTTPQWETLLDIDQLGKDENESWVFGGAQLRRPDFTRALISLKPGGTDANVVREFDVEKKEFVEDGFYSPASKGSLQWTTDDSVLIARDFGEGTLTNSGYPRTVRLWKRGTALEDAPIILEGEAEDILVGASHDFTVGYERTFAVRATDFRDTIVYEVDGETLELTELKVPHSASVGTVKDWVVLELRYDWNVDGTVFPAGSLLTLPYEEALNGPRAESITTLFTPTATASLSSMAELASGVVFTTLDNVRSRAYFAPIGTWSVTELHPDLGEFDSIGITAVDQEKGDDVWVVTTGFLTPTTLLHGTASQDGLEVKKVRSAPERFNADGMVVRQEWATSKDGTKIPYFLVGSEQALSGQHPARTLLDGYGGFEISNIPGYIGTYGKAWLEDGGVYALANIRGGGEFGPAWHQQAQKEGRHLAYEDFAAVAQHLVETGVTTVDQLAATGGSNGGLLIGNMYTTYPELFGALICRVPLLDMKRFSHLLAGASWMDEYGNPDTGDWEFLQNYSPYHNVKEDRTYPPILVTTSTRDDRVHPGHARKFVALLEEQGHDVTYFENTEGGHAGAADAKQSARSLALIFTFLDEKLAK
ncbi:prolyl oligopeptidase family serine peptidase [Flaviflexus massiliensis]|uniref:prolyl oligopeptidase family serine peptidase n=1 Tax=Flaviflexus massiliensis TaxID=1522309 RepID=UPI0006D5B389|nr:prolyl oligopeptidase family serine peptidase [Flaviflexus massiliensis]